MEEKKSSYNRVKTNKGRDDEIRKSPFGNHRSNRRFKQE